MLQHLRPALVLIVLFSVLTGLVYPLAVTGIAQIALPYQANGSLIQKDGVVIHFPAQFEGFFAGVGDVDGVGIFSKGASNEARNFSFVFGQENAHKLMVTIISR